VTTAAAEDRERVGPYRVIQAIGAGGSARIDLARIDRAYGFQRHVVIKRPLEHLRGNANVAASLRREARLGGQLRHPHLVAILDAGTHDGYDYLVLEYVHGAALRTLMQAEAPGQVRELPLAVALAIVTDVARGLHEAHELTDDQGAPLGLVHRDVSPGNILLGLDGTVKLADFGIAKETRVSTLSGSMHGTVTYMAPEQCQGHAFDRRADVFSLGVILYELVTGTRLFWADNDVASLHRVLSGTVPRPRELQPRLDGALEDIVMAAVAHDAGQRYPTALALADALERYAADAGEVLGARWIARTMEDLIGPRQVPWIAAATRPDALPRGDGSLVDLIAADEPDEPAPPSFGDAGDEAGRATAEPSEPPRDAPSALNAPSAPANRAPTTHAPATHAPTTHAPATHAPAPHAPAPHAPATHAPAPRTPANHAPASHAPAPCAPASRVPATSAANMPRSPAPTAPAPRAPASHAPAPRASSTPLSSAPSAPARRTRRRQRALVTAIMALGVLGGTAATAILMTRGSGGAPASATTRPASSAGPAPASAPPPATALAPPPATVLAPPPGSPAPTVPSVDTPTQPTAAPPSANHEANATDEANDQPPAVMPATVPPPIASDAPAAAPSPAVVKKKPRRQPAIKASPRAPAEAKGNDHEAHEASKASSGEPPATGAGSGSSPPAARPPANVEWKPTLLLPTDGSGAKAPK
jgi:serine/threonine protein kinase